ncbi:MAG: hypothetical protein FWG89_05840 [Treponema sp.]|nr:hypothetical protein [Treponema sp.]
MKKKVYCTILAVSLCFGMLLTGCKNPAGPGQPSHIPVTDILFVPSKATAGVALPLSGTVVPDNATNRIIVWSTASAGAIITDNALTVTQPGTVVVTATIANGLTRTTPYTQNFYIHVDPVPSYGISLSPTTAHVFAPAIFGYAAAPDALIVMVNNTGNQVTGELAVGLSGANAASFSLFVTTISLGVGSSAWFPVQPNTGLAEGTHSATLTVSGGNGITASLNISFTVL